MSLPINLAAPRKDFKVTAGDDLVLTIILKKDGVPHTLTGWAIDIDVRDSCGDEAASYSIGNGVTPQLAVGSALVKIEGSVTQKLNTEKFLNFDIQTISPEGIKKTYLTSKVIADKDFTRP